MTSSIRLQDYIEPGTRARVFWGAFWILTIMPVIIVVTIVVTYGVALIAWLIALATYSSRVRKAQALLHGSALRVSARQFPEIHQTAEALSRLLGMPICPDLYIVEDNQQNAFAMKHGSRKSVLLVDDIIFGALATGHEKVLAWIIAHELAHHALGHTNRLRSMIRSGSKSLMRLDEFSCDAVAHALVADPTAAREALSLMLVGPHLYGQVDKESLAAQAHEVAANRYSRRCESRLTHPLLLRRYARFAPLQGQVGGTRLAGALAQGSQPVA